MFRYSPPPSWPPWCAVSGCLAGDFRWIIKDEVTGQDWLPPVPSIPLINKIYDITRAIALLYIACVKMDPISQRVVVILTSMDFVASVHPFL
jgi:hypothetical protein